MTKIRQLWTYLAGRMRHCPLNNIPAFDKHRDSLRARGWGVTSPADLDREAGFDGSKMDPDAEYDQEPFIRRDVDAILKNDAVAMIPDWEKSTGAPAEFFLAIWAGKIIIDAETGGPLRDVKWCDIIENVHNYLEEYE